MTSSSTTQKQKRTLKTITVVIGFLLVSCLVCIATSVLCVNTGIMTAATGVDSLKKEVTSKVCLNNLEEIQETYKNETTSRFQALYSEEEFAEKITFFDIGTCNSIKDASIFDLFTKSWSIGIVTNPEESRVTFEGAIKDKQTRIILVKANGQSAFTIDELEIEK